MDILVGLQILGIKEHIANDGQVLPSIAGLAKIFVDFLDDVGQNFPFDFMLRFLIFSLCLAGILEVIEDFITEVGLGL